MAAPAARVHRKWTTWCMDARGREPSAPVKAFHLKRGGAGMLIRARRRRRLVDLLRMTREKTLQCARAPRFTSTGDLRSTSRGRRLTPRP